MKNRAGTVIPSGVATLFSLFVLTSCGPGVDLSGGNAGGTAIGPVAGFGSIRVEGTDFSGDNAATIVDDQGRAIDNVVEGMMVAVRGTMDSTFLAGTAGTLTVERAVRGPVDDNGVFLDNNTVRVLGQTVLVNPGTVFVRFSGGETDLSTLNADMDNSYRPELEVHGGMDGQGVIHATFLGRGRDNVVANDNVALRGAVAGLSAGTTTFLIGTRQVNYDNAVRVAWPATGIANGDFVDVRGPLSAVGRGGVVRADRVEILTPGLGNPGDRVKLEGYIVGGSPGSFVMNTPGGPVSVLGAVPTGDAFGIGRLVRVKGTVSGSSGSGVQAMSVDLPFPNTVRMEGSPTAITPSSNTMTLLGRTVETNDFTLFRDATGAVRRGFGLGSLALSDTVRVVGTFDATVLPGKVVASTVERLSASPATRVTLQGPISDFAPVSPPLLTILGMSVRTDIVNTEYFDLGGVAFPGQSGFFQALANGTVVKVTNGVFTGGPPRIDPPTTGALMEVGIVQVNR